MRRRSSGWPEDVEKSGRSVAITRRGRVVARLQPPLWPEVDREKPLPPFGLSLSKTERPPHLEILSWMYGAARHR